jgi:hypothetical protein
MRYIGNQNIDFWDSERVLRANPQTITASTTLASGWNSSTVGKVTIASGATVTIASGCRWVIL